MSTQPTIEFRQEIVPPDDRDIPRPLGSEELRVDHPIVYRRGPFRKTITAVMPLARWASSSIKYGPKLVPRAETSERQDEKCPFCYPGTSAYLQDPRYTWCEAPWLQDYSQNSRADNLFVGVRPDYYSRFQTVLFHTKDHVDTIESLAARREQYLCGFLNLAVELSRRIPSDLDGHLLVGGISFGLVWKHFHFNIGTCPMWVTATHAYGEDYWQAASSVGFGTEFRARFAETAAQCQGLRDYPKNPDLIVADSENFLWLVPFAGRSEHECVILSKRTGKLSALTAAEIQELSRALWTIICYYKSIDLAEGRFVVGFWSLMGEHGAGDRGLVFEVLPCRSVGYLEWCHGSYLLGDWPENVAARIRGFNECLNRQARVVAAS